MGWFFESLRPSHPYERGRNEMIKKLLAALKEKEDTKMIQDMIGIGIGQTGCCFGDGIP